MRISCLHGYFKFEEFKVGEISSFINMYGLNIVPSYDHFTFEPLKNAPRYSVKGAPYISGATGTVTFEGEPWEVMKANGLVYNFKTGIIVPLASINQIAKVQVGVEYYYSNGLLLPGSVTDDGLRVTDYSAHLLDRFNFVRYTEVSYV